MIVKLKALGHNNNVSPRHRRQLRIARPSKRELARSNELLGETLLHYIADLEAIQIEGYRFRNSRAKGQLLRGLPEKARVKVDIKREEVRAIERVGRILCFPHWRFDRPADVRPVEYPGKCAALITRVWEAGEDGQAGGDSIIVDMPRKEGGLWYVFETPVQKFVAPAVVASDTERYELAPEED